LDLAPESLSYGLGEAGFESGILYGGDEDAAFAGDLTTGGAEAVAGAAGNQEGEREGERLPK
jgi:hypothetical protein